MVDSPGHLKNMRKSSWIKIPRGKSKTMFETTNYLEVQDTVGNLVICRFITLGLGDIEPTYRDYNPGDPIHLLGILNL